jgi:hypothetical protein
MLGVERGHLTPLDPLPSALFPHIKAITYRFTGWHWQKRFLLKDTSQSSLAITIYIYAKAKIIRILKALIANQEACEVIAIANLNLEELEHGDFSSIQLKPDF